MIKRSRFLSAMEQHAMIAAGPMPCESHSLLMRCALWCHLTFEDRWELDTLL